MYTPQQIKEILNPELDTFGYPTPEQLTKINNIAPEGVVYAEYEVITIPILAMNNLLLHSLEAWDNQSIVNMSKLFIGAPFTIDHEWNDSEDIFGIIYDSRYVIQDDAPEVFKQELSPLLNQMQINLFGFAQLFLYGYIPLNCKEVADIKYRRKCNVSIGGYSDGSSYCPICTEDYGELVSFNDERCPHIKPSMDAFLWLSADEQKRIAPYVIKGGFNEAMEISAVMKGNCPTARIL